MPRGERTARHRVLIIDDEESTRLLLARYLSKDLKVEAQLAGTCEQALRFGGTMLCTAPSTTTAIALRLKPDAKPASHLEPPACLLHHWRPELGLITHLSPIGTFPGPYAFA